MAPNYPFCENAFNLATHITQTFEMSFLVKFVTTSILKFSFCTIAAYSLLLAHPNFDSCIRKNRQLVHFCAEVCIAAILLNALMIQHHLQMTGSEIGNQPQ